MARGWHYVKLSLSSVLRLSFSGMCVCVCVCLLPIHSGHQVRWTYQPGSHRRNVTQDFHPLLSAVRALIFLARRIQPFLSLVDREVEFCILTIESFSTHWAFFFFFFFFF